MEDFKKSKIPHYKEKWRKRGKVIRIAEWGKEQKFCNKFTVMFATESFLTRKLPDTQYLIWLVS